MLDIVKFEHWCYVIMLTYETVRIGRRKYQENYRRIFQVQKFWGIA